MSYTIQNNPVINLDLIRKYDKTGPRYTSYPTAVVFHENFTVKDYRNQALKSNKQLKMQPISLYFHIPFCDTLCFFCACNKIATKKREKADVYLDYLEKEMELVSKLYDKARVVEQMHFGGGTPTFLTNQQFKRLIKLIGKYFTLITSNKRDYSIEIDPRSVNVEDIKLLTNFGFNRFSLGVQDVNPIVQKAVNRIQPIQLTESIIQACRDNNALSVSVDLIYGLPFQTIASFSDTLDTVIKMSPDRLSVFNYAHLPHLFMPQKRINAQDLPKAEEKLKILQLSIEKLTQAGYVYIGMDHFAKPDDELALAQKNGTLQRNFQGYTTHAELDLVALGVSSISSVNHSYSQNVKSTQQYYAMLDNNQLPLYRGYLLNKDDKVRKAVIQQLACHFSLDIKSFENIHTINFTEYFKTELLELTLMQVDGLLSFDKKSIQVSDTGRLLIRNICMIFDKYINQKANQKISKVI